MFRFFLLFLCWRIQVAMFFFISFYIIFFGFVSIICLVSSVIMVFLSLYGIISHLFKNIFLNVKHFKSILWEPTVRKITRIV